MKNPRGCRETLAGPVGKETWGTQGARRNALANLCGELEGGGKENIGWLREPYGKKSAKPKGTTREHLEKIIAENLRGA